MIDLLHWGDRPENAQRDNETCTRRGREVPASSLGRFGKLAAAQFYTSQAVVHLVESLHLRRRWGSPVRGAPVDVIAHAAAPLIVANDLHEISMLALHMSATIQTLDIMKNLSSATRLQVDRRPNPEAA